MPTLQYTRIAALAALATMLAIGTTANAAKTPTPEEYLSSRGLEKADDGKTYIVRAESQFGKAVADSQVIWGKVNEAYNKWEAMVTVSNMVQMLGDRRIALNAEINDLQLQLNNLPNNNLLATRTYRQEFNQGIQARRLALNEAIAEFNIWKKRESPPWKIEEAYKEFEKWRVAFLEEGDKLNGIYSKAANEYDSLKQDPDIKNALSVLGRRQKPVQFYSLGWTKNTKRLKEGLLDQTKLVSEKANLRRKKSPKKSAKAPAVKPAAIDNAGQ
jgi:hypothetical protein